MPLGVISVQVSVPLGVISVYVSGVAAVVTATYSISPDVVFVKFKSFVTTPDVILIASAVCVNAVLKVASVKLTTFMFSVVIRKTELRSITHLLLY